MNIWVYLFGERNGADIKVGYSKKPNLAERLKEVNDDQTTSESYVVLAAAVGSLKEEKAIKRYFAPIQRKTKGTRTEYFEPQREIVDYANWLRSQWWVATECDILLGDMPVEDPGHWLPTDDRRIARPLEDPTRLIQPYDDLEGSLRGTAWSWMVSPRAQVQDYFTPPELVSAAREAMGGIDLDAASHWLANREHRITDYFHTGRSAFENDWYGRVWLNPPYGNNAPWFDRIVKYVSSGEIDQLCMISPMWAFQTRLAQPLLALSSAMILLSPTPEFWGNSEGRTGTNNPHGILYIGSRVAEFKRAFRGFGMAVTLDRDEWLPAGHRADQA